ncbi:MAG: hypothetical protein ACLUVV_00025 [Christensenellales bacterium]
MAQAGGSSGKADAAQLQQIYDNGADLRYLCEMIDYYQERMIECRADGRTVGHGSDAVAGAGRRI